MPNQNRSELFWVFSVSKCQNCSSVKKRSKSSIWVMLSKGEAYLIYGANVFAAVYKMRASLVSKMTNHLQEYVWLKFSAIAIKIIWIIIKHQVCDCTLLSKSRSLTGPSYSLFVHLGIGIHFGQHKFWLSPITGVNKKPKKIQNCLAWISDDLKTVWQGESGELKTVCWFFKYCLSDFLNFYALQIAWFDWKWRR